MTQSELKTFVKYDPETGIFTSKKSERRIGFLHNCRTKKNREAGRKDKFYRKIEFHIGGKSPRFYEHRLAILYMFGTEPTIGQEVDHLNGDGTDNRIVNLMVKSRSENCHNNTWSKGISNHRGVTYNTHVKRWIASIVVDKKKTTRSYLTEQEATDTRRLMEKSLKEKGFVDVGLFPPKKNQFG